MQPPSPLSLASTWDLVAADYTREVVPVFQQYVEQAWTLAGVGPGSRVLDVAAGPGTLSLLALARGAQVEALDFSPRMIESLRERLTVLGPDERGRIHARVGDGMALPYGEAEFDAGFSIFGLMFFPDRAAGFRELARVLRPGARCVVSSWQPMHENPVLSAAGEALGALTAPAQPESGPAVPPSLPLSTRESCHEEMEAAGFRQVVVHAPVGRAQFANASEMVASFGRSNVMFRLTKERLGAAAWEEVEREIARRVARRFGAGPIDVAMPAFITVGER